MTPLLTYAIEKQHFADVREVSARRLSLSRKALDPRPLTRLCSPSLQVELVRKMVFFQCLNNTAVALSFFIPFQWGRDATTRNTFDHCAYFDHSWYVTGAPAVLNVLIGDATAINLFVEGVRPFDAFIARKWSAPRAATQDRQARSGVAGRAALTSGNCSRRSR